MSSVFWNRNSPQPQKDGRRLQCIPSVIIQSKIPSKSPVQSRVQVVQTPSQPTPPLRKWAGSRDCTTHWGTIMTIAMSVDIDIFLHA